jgi:hypothetical protein
VKSIFRNSRTKLSVPKPAVKSVSVQVRVNDCGLDVAMSKVVSLPSFASLYPVAWRKRCGCRGNSKPACLPSSARNALTFCRVIGVPRLLKNTCLLLGFSLRSRFNARSSCPVNGWTLGIPFFVNRLPNLTHDRRPILTLLSDELGW